MRSDELIYSIAQSWGGPDKRPLTGELKLLRTQIRKEIVKGLRFQINNAITEIVKAERIKP